MYIVILAASASFASPFSDSINVTIMGAGGYKRKDFLKLGLPLNLIAMVATIGLCWLMFA